MNSIKNCWIDEVVVIDEFNVRADQLSQAKIAEYTEIFKQLPPVSVYDCDGKLYLVDGWHRMEAARKLELTEIQVSVEGAGTLIDAQDFADQANLRHGIMLTPDQRRQIGLRFVNRHTDWSLREVAEKMGCSHVTVKNWIDQSAVKNLTVDVPNQEREQKASQSDRAGGVDIRAVTLKFREWLNQSMRKTLPEEWTKERKEKVRDVLKPIVEFYNQLAE